MFKITKKTLIFLAIGFVLVAGAIWVWENRQTDPLGEAGEQAKGVLRGHVTVGPICPVQKPDQPCPVPAQAYTSREIIIYASDGKTVVAGQHFDGQGNYSLVLSPGDYIVDTPHDIGRRGSGLPKNITIKSNETLELDFDIDTGIR